jgi:hypothetical protein
MSLHACLWRRAACRQRRSLNSDASFQGRCLCLRPWTGRADDDRSLGHRGDVGNTKPSPRPTHRQGLMVPQPGNAGSCARRWPLHLTQRRIQTGPSTEVQSLPQSGREIRPKRYLDSAYATSCARCSSELIKIFGKARLQKSDALGGHGIDP